MKTFTLSLMGVAGVSLLLFPSPHLLFLLATLWLAGAVVWALSLFCSWASTPGEKAKKKPKPIPPKTRKQLFKEAKAKYEETLQMLSRSNLNPHELRAAKEKAKQKYLREIDGVL